MDNPAADIAKGAFAGLIGGLAGTWVMTRFQYAVPPDTFSEVLGEKQEQEQSDESGEQADDRPATVEVADSVTETVLDEELPEEYEDQAGQIVHYTFGASSAAAYGVLAEVLPQVTRSGGLGFGAALWLLGDEVGVSAAGLSEPPWEHPPSVHAYGLAAHLVYGVTSELVRRTVRRLM